MTIGCTYGSGEIRTISVNIVEEPTGVTPDLMACGAAGFDFS